MQYKKILNKNGNCEKSNKIYILIFLSCIFSATNVMSFTFSLTAKNPYYHVLEQLDWISFNSKNKSNLSVGKPIKIYYHENLLYRVTSSQGCRYKCIFTNHPGDLLKGDLAVFSNRVDKTLGIKLKRRGIFLSFESSESPVHLRNLSESELSLIDFIITSMPWSEVPFMYPMFIRNENPEYMFTEEELKIMLAKDNKHLLPQNFINRKKLVAWMVSGHEPENYRKEFADNLKNFVQVDIYENGGLTVPPGRDPLQWLSENYKFYLSFENSNCEYYTTEKMTSNSMRYGLVPIVTGAHREDYIAILPPHSFINVHDFKSFEELGNYLKYLDTNDTAYAEYFAWKAYGRIHVDTRLDCRTCGFMHQLKERKKTLNNISWRSFMFSEKMCYERSFLPLYMNQTKAII